MSDHSIFNELGPKQGGFLGLSAIIDAMNPWDLVKGFARGMRWLFVGHRYRESDESYNKKLNDMVLGNGGPGHARKATKDLPIAYEFRRSNFGIPMKTARDEEGATLLANAQPHPLNHVANASYVPASQRYDPQGGDISNEGTHYDSHYDSPYDGQDSQIGIATSGPSQPYQSQVPLAQQYLQQKRDARNQRSEPRPTRPQDSRTPVIHEELWGAEPAPRPTNGQF